MASGYEVAGIDLDSILSSYIITQAAVTNYQVAGVDMNARYAKLSNGSAPAITNYQVAGADLNTIFAAIGTVIPTNLYFSSTASTTLTNSNQLIVSTPSSETSATTTITASGAHSYAAILPQGGTVVASLNAPLVNGQGFFFENPENCFSGKQTTASSGNFTAHLTADPNVGVNLTFYVMVFKYNAGTYTQLGSTSSGTINNNTKSSISISVPFTGTISFSSGDTIYVQIYVSTASIHGSVVLYMNGGLTEGSLVLPAIS